ncbi:SpoIIE family protein phosphatase [Streptomyces sp. MSC1_001]|jgi:PAS domain S-box-containing protein|uniref:SpoIIE family protein phosphatase n=1 Tax=Streptomyces sp. MSC1_001 TaxID=2909263 RepID=UPI00202FA360|nr:SpoIIE family protein phosphatase [Streptomyces sp. MSC1_001]
MEGLPFTPPAGADEGGHLGPPPAAFALLAADGVLVGWSREAETLLGYTASEVLGRRAVDLIATPHADRDGPEEPRWDQRPRLGGARSAVVDVRHRGGDTVRVAVALHPLTPAPDGASSGQAPHAVLMATELEGLRWWETRQAMLEGLVTQSPVTLTIYGPGARLLWANASSVRELGGDLSTSLGRSMTELFPGDVLTAQHLAPPEDLFRQILETGEPVIDVHFRGRAPADPRREHVWSSSYFRLLDGRGEPVGVCEQSIDVTDHYRAQQRLALLAEAGARIGSTLDPAGTAAELAKIAVPQYADAVSVDVAAEVLEGEEPKPATARDLVRVADSDGDPSRVGERVAYAAGSAQAESLALGRSTTDAVVPPTRLYVPLIVRGTPLGLVTFVRGDDAEPFDDGDRSVAEELASRTAVCIDNARRYRREHTAAFMLQRSLLPRSLPELSAVEAASRYLPADSHLGAGGDWFDVIPLSGARVGLVVGDVAGHGLGAAAAMGRLRAMVRTLAELDLAPDELLARLNDQVGKDASDQGGTGADGSGAVGATCVYGVYDPASRTSTWAAAGHQPPAVVQPHSPVRFLRLPPGLPLGVGRLPYEGAEEELAEGSLVVLFTDGLVEARGKGVDVGLDRLATVLGEQRGSSPDRSCARIVAALASDEVRDDATLLVVRTRALGARQVATWELPPDPALVARARSMAAEQLGRWGLDDLVFTTEVVVSELVTNAIRHAFGLIGLRLIRDRSLICEVSDSQHTSPHARYAGSDEEGGRGLFMVAQLTEHWGTRYTPAGKTIWAEQALPLV